MTTTVTKTIGSSGRDYSTVQSWFDALPSNLVTADTVQIGECYNDSLFTAGIIASGKTTDSTRNIILRAHSGQGFNTHASRLTHALTLDTANGVSMKYNTSVAPVFDFNQSDMLIEGIQFFGGGAGTTFTVALHSNAVISACIISGYNPDDSSTQTPLSLSDTATAKNCVVLAKDNFPGINAENDCFANIQFCTIVNWGETTSSNKYPIGASYSTASSYCSAGFGFMPSTTDWTRTGHSGTNDYNASDCTDTGSIGTHSLTALTLTSQFTAFGAALASLDLRLKSTSALVNAATPISGITTDIYGQTRDATTPSIGAWEYLVVTPTGDLAVTEGADTLAGTGAVIGTLTSSLAKTEGADTLSTTASLSSSGALAVTEGADTLAGSSAIGDIIAFLARTEGADSLVAAASIGLSAALAKTEGADTLLAYTSIPQSYTIAVNNPPLFLEPPPDPRTPFDGFQWQSWFYRAREAINARGVVARGTATLMGGTVTIPLANILATNQVYLSVNDPVNTGNKSVVIIPSVGFTIHSSNASDASTLSWLVI